MIMQAEMIGRAYVIFCEVRRRAYFFERMMSKPTARIVRCKPTVNATSNKTPVPRRPTDNVAAKIAQAVGHGANEPINPSQSA